MVEISGRHGLVLSGHSLASRAAAELMLAGGNACDAAIAAAAVLCVTRPQACTLGGDAFILVHRPGEGTVVLNGSGACPMAVTSASFPDGIPATGALTATVPTLVRAWDELHRRYGKLRWGDILQRAVEYAANGFSLTKDVAGSIERGWALLNQDSGCAELFLRNGGIRSGQIFHQPALGDVLSGIADEGPDYFYRGPVAKALCAFSARSGGAFREADFENATVEWAKPVTARYRDLTIDVAPPNSYGLLLPLQLKWLEEAGETLLGDDASRLATLIGAARKAFKAGVKWIADPRAVQSCADVSVDALFEGAGRGEGNTVPNPGGTSVVSVVDEQGNAVVIVQSVFAPWGAVALDPKTGILLNNRMRGFSLREGDRNILAPGKRPAHTLCPTMATENGRLRYLLASPGGAAQTTTMAQLVINLVDRQMTIADAVRAPRWSLDEKGGIILEPAIPGAVQESLRDAGIAAVHGASHSPFFGSGQIVRIDDDGLARSARDPRRDDLAIAI